MTRYKTSVLLDKSHVKTFKSFYPQKGSLQWFIGECLKQFNKAHTDLNDVEIENAVTRALTSHLTTGDER